MNDTSACSIIEADLDNFRHQTAFLSLLGLYIEDKMGGGKPHSGAQEFKIISDLREHPARLILLASRGELFVGMVVCFWVYSTFKAASVLNVHDLIVHPDYRREGIGRCLMARVESIAENSGAAKVTLEVRYDNIEARKLYMKMGYGECQTPMSFWVKNVQTKTDHI